MEVEERSIFPFAWTETWLVQSKNSLVNCLRDAQDRKDWFSSVNQKSYPVLAFSHGLGYAYAIDVKIIERMHHNGGKHRQNTHADSHTNSNLRSG